MSCRSGRHKILNLNSNQEINQRIEGPSFAVKAVFAHQNSQLMELIANVPVELFAQCCSESYVKLFQSNDFEMICELTKNDYAMWHKKRRWLITGSRCHAMFQCSKRHHINWDKICNGYFNPKSFTNEFVEHGRKYESAARKEFSKYAREKLGLSVVEVGLVISPINPWLAYSPDGVLVQNQNVCTLLEIKCPFKGKKMTIDQAIQFDASTKYLDFKNENGLSLKEGHAYYSQIQFGMAILNLPCTYFVLYASFDGSMIVVRVLFDNLFAQNMLLALKKVFFSKMLHFICTANKSSIDSDSETVNAMEIV